jgi:hypothetical protein
MKSTDFKKLIKEAVREAIQEELKDILLEAIRTPKTLVKESFTPTPVPPQPTNPSYAPPSIDFRSKYAEVLGETAMSFTSQDAQPSFRPQSSDPVNGNLGTGELGMDQIMGLLNTK